MDWYSEDRQSRIYCTADVLRLVVSKWRPRRKEWGVIAVFQFGSAQQTTQAFNLLTRSVVGIWD